MDMSWLTSLLDEDNEKKYSFAILVTLLATGLAVLGKIEGEVWGWTVVGMGSLLAGADIGSKLIQARAPGVQQ